MDMRMRKRDKSRYIEISGDKERLGLGLEVKNGDEVNSGFFNLSFAKSIRGGDNGFFR